MSRSGRFRVLGWGLGLALVAGAPAAGAAGSPVNLSDMDADERALFDKVTGGEMCPCGSAMSLAKCLPRADVCGMAVELANVAARSVRQGRTYGEVVDALIRHLERASKPHEFDVRGRARKGPEKAAVTLVEFSDFECPHCNTMRPVLDAVRAAFPKDVAVVFKHFPLPFHEHAANAAAAVEVAHAQGKFWALHDKVFDAQADLSQARLHALMKEVGIDPEKVGQAAWAAAKARVVADVKEGNDSGLQGTPTIFLNGIEVPGEDYTPDALKRRVKEALAAQRR